MFNLGMSKSDNRLGWQSPNKPVLRLPKLHDGFGLSGVGMIPKTATQQGEVCGKAANS